MNEMLEKQLKIDLENVEIDDILELNKDIKSEIVLNEKIFKEVLEDRRNQIDIVKTLREIMKEVDSMDSNRRNLLSEFNKYRKAAENAKKIRDSVNELIPPPSEILEKWIMNTYENLTMINNDLTTVPTLERERDLFKKFFELQVCINKKRESEKAHIEYVNNITKLREVAKKLDLQREEKEKNISEINDNQESDGSTVSRKEIRKVSKNISLIDKKLDSLKMERAELKKFLNRVKKELKKTNLAEKRISITKIKDKLIDGSSLDTSEFDALLSQGGLSTISVEKEKKIDNSNRLNKRKKMRRIGSIKRKSRKGNSAALREND